MAVDSSDVFKINTIVCTTQQGAEEKGFVFRDLMGHKSFLAEHASLAARDGVEYTVWQLPNFTDKPIVVIDSLKMIFVLGKPEESPKVGIV